MRRHGRGPRHFVGLHGWSGSHRSFDPLLFARPENATFWAMDLPGAGASVRPSSWSAEAVTARVVSALEGLGVRKVTLVAACGGIGFGLLLAAQRPDLVARLVLIDPFAFVPWYFRLFTWPVLGRPLFLLSFANPIGRRLTDGALADRRTDETSLTEGFQEVEHTQNHRMLQAMCDAARVPLRAFGVFPGEVDIVYGARTFAAVKSSVRRLVQEPFPEARVFRAEAAGHLPMHEASAQVAEIVFGSSG
ncbi:MAG: alpha/beta hydrolase [Myxococcota bacterium]